MERKIVIVAAGAIIGCMAGCYTPNNDRHSMMDFSTEDPCRCPSAYPGMYMGQPNIHLDHLDLSHLHFSGIPTQ